GGLEEGEKLRRMRWFSPSLGMVWGFFDTLRRQGFAAFYKSSWRFGTFFQEGSKKTRRQIFAALNISSLPCFLGGKRAGVGATPQYDLIYSSKKFE
ncbi:MAG: hypothetical protein ACI3YH_01230, partial [Eubacteriales bacterium]